MTRAFRWPPRHAPGFPAGCADAGDVLAHLARTRHASVTLAVVTSALRATVEQSGDHEQGLVRVRRSLAELGRAAGAPWHPSYYGKDLVLVRPGEHGPVDAHAPTSGIRHGSAWEHVPLPAGAEARLAALLRACYAVSMAARAVRDRPESRGRGRAADVLAAVPGRLSDEGCAALLAGVLVRPSGGSRAVRGAGPGEDPRLPGVPSADAWPAYAQQYGQHGKFAGRGPAHYVVTDVHDIEWGTVVRHPSPRPSPSPRPGIDGRRTAGNAHLLLPLAAAWRSGTLPTPVVLRRAHGLRIRRESLLVEHLRALGDGGGAAGGRLFAALGDGLCGLVTDPDALRTAVYAANARTAGQLHSGAGVAEVTGAFGAAELRAAAGRAQFALHVTKTLKASTHEARAYQEFGRPLDAAAGETAVAFLRELYERGPGARGGHHLAHAVRHRDHWRRHLPPTATARFDGLMELVVG
ncbi:hypothetical protein ACH4E8_16345 [Streptomyces sp. NPDC017979]|uniref:hypothetical protein n=1 Tax=Streptomyces sp. NPDC017979 TaxID=3365024 RepID=UPI0037922F57